MAKATQPTRKKCALLKSCLAYHLACLREDATDPAMSPLERLTLVQDRAARLREIRQALSRVRRPS